MHSFSATEELSGLYQVDIDLVAEKQNAAQVVGETLLGQQASLAVSVGDDFIGGPWRYFHGLVSYFATGDTDDVFAHYRAQIVPWLWLATLDKKSRIFQSMTVPEIVDKIFKEFQAEFPTLVHFDYWLTGTYTKFDYCVQYQESSFDFVSRLLEEEGIFYFFEHTRDKHTLVLGDSPQAIKPCPEQPKADWAIQSDWTNADRPVLSWATQHKIQPGKYTLRDFHFQMPGRSLEVQEPTIIASQPGGPIEVFEYPGEYASRFHQTGREGEVTPEAQRLVRLRMQEREARYREDYGRSLCRAFTAGQKFELVGGSGNDRNFAITSVRHAAGQYPWYTADSSSSNDEPYSNTFSCIPESVTYRPARRTPKPRVYGPQTAIVVGKDGEEIWTDEFGRVKVQFHWDREGNMDENSSCWVRVSHPWAGKNWGAVSIPRVGQEVIVDFLEGDPDQPIITGRVFNSEQIHPFQLPDSAATTGIKSNSTPGGGGYNEISMDDTNGTELINLHAQYDMAATVEHDDTQTVHNNRQITVDGTQNELITCAVSETYQDSLTTTVTNSIDVSSKTSYIHLVAPTEISLTSGKSALVLKGDGTIVLLGTQITITGTDHVFTLGGHIKTRATNLHEVIGELVKIN